MRLALQVRTVSHRFASTFHALLRAVKLVKYAAKPGERGASLLPSIENASM
jgi:hypothetical protein